ncbi:hypothetical protein N7454_007048 [Penicillium verhagenii]|nr:hypothetical protein N7454_007048 [Penicillium verhagenii]
MSSIPLYIAVTHGDGAFKHWGLFIDDKNQTDKTVLQVKGSDGSFRYEAETKDARNSPDLIQLIYLCNVDLPKANSIKSIAGRVEVHNDISGWNCQDYVLDLMDELEEKGVLDGLDVRYRTQMDYIRGMQEGLA